MATKNHRKNLGAKSEETAVKWIEKKGFSILGRNFKTRFGEIDIIAERENVVYFFEVRSGRSGSSIRMIRESISRRKLHRLYTVGQTFLQRESLINRSYVFMLLSVVWVSDDEPKVSLTPIT